MEKTFFYKYHGLQNSFIVIDRTHSNQNASQRLNADPDQKSDIPTAQQCRFLCDPRVGIGADGVLTLLPPSNDKATVYMHVTNADGTVARNCGNGLRCVAKWLLDQDRVKKDEFFIIETVSGLREVKITPKLENQSQESVSPSSWRANKCERGHPENKSLNNRISVNMGQAKILKLNRFRLAESLNVPQDTWIDLVELGNLHLVINHPNPTAQKAQQIAAKLRASQALQQKEINVGLYDMSRPNAVDFCVHEYGAGETQACGSGACALTAMLVVRNRVQTDYEITVNQPGGQLMIQQSAEKNIWMEGPAEFIFQGSITLPSAK